MPLAILYGGIIFLRNKLYDWGFSSSLKFTLPIISIGNLNVGGTGKTPHTDYLIQLLKNQYHLATLSRGYKRATRGYVLANENTTAWHIGDEPMQTKRKHPHVQVCVCEDRIMAVPTLLQQAPLTEIILLDDAFQHRSIAPSLNILITDCNHLYTKDYILPFGRLREFRSGAKRANIIIVSKCDTNITEQKAASIVNELQPKSHQTVFFTSLEYQPFVHLFSQENVTINGASLLVVSGIANPTSLLAQIRTVTSNFHYLQYRDHHYFSVEDLEEMQVAYNALPGTKKYLVTTEKDAARLLLHQDLILQYQIEVVVLPIEIKFLMNGEHQFSQIIHSHIQQFYPPLPAAENAEDFPTDTTTSTSNGTENYVYTVS